MPVKVRYFLKFWICEMGNAQNNQPPVMTRLESVGCSQAGRQAKASNWDAILENSSQIPRTISGTLQVGKGRVWTFVLPAWVPYLGLMRGLRCARVNLAKGCRYGESGWAAGCSDAVKLLRKRRWMVDGGCPERG
jgi:hypothetical protein